VLLQVVLWVAVGLGWRLLLRKITKLLGFALFIVISYALVADDPARDRWVDVTLLGWTFQLNAGGVGVGVTMVLRVATIVLASQVVRAGDPRAISAGLSRLGLPRSAALTLDAVLVLLGGGGGGGGGGGRGGGRGRHRDEAEDGAPRMTFWEGVSRLRRGDVAPIVGRIERHIARTERHLTEHGDGIAPAKIRDLAVIAGLSLTMLGVRALKILPAIPFAPGHKLVILTPLYIVASLLTRGRFGATLTGLTMGTVAFLMGDGRYGVFEIAKHVAPGILCDLGVPLLHMAGRAPGAVVWSLFGGVVAAGRFATIFMTTLLVQAPSVAFAILVPGLVVHVTFGLVSGYVTWHIVKSLGHWRAELANTETKTP
jgi:hypothetical protein